MGWQFGLQYKDFIIQSSRLRVEYNWMDHRVYRNKIALNDYYHYGYPLGFWAGPHSEEFYIDYLFVILDTKFIISYSKAKRGELTDQMLADAYEDIFYERYADIVEKKQIASMVAIRKIFSNLEMHFGFDIINWGNAGFEPYNDPIGSLNELKDVNKISFSLGMYYNYENRKLR